MVLLEALTVALAGYLVRQPSPQRYLPGRIGAFYFLLKRISGMIQLPQQFQFVIRWIQKFAELGMLNFVIMALSRFSPGLLAVPETWTGKGLRTGKITWPMNLFWLPWMTAEQLIFHRITSAILNSKKPFLEKYNLVHSDKVHGDLYVGMWPGFFRNQLPPNIDLVVDMSNEYPESDEVIQGRRYICCPIWDQAMPLDKERFVRTVEEAAFFKGNIYVHCGFGVGRSVLAVICILMRRRIASDYKEAYQMVKSVRPFVDLKSSAMEFLDEISPRLL